jgi:hypothetical protein
VTGSVARVVERGLAVAEEEALEIAHRVGKVIGDPGDGRQADETVALGDLAVLGDKGEGGLVEGGVEDSEDGELWRLVEIIRGGAHQAAPATLA